MFVDIEEPDFVYLTASWNPWHGCHKVCRGCKNCYMFEGNKKHGITDSNVVKKSMTAFDYPLRKDKNGLYLLRDKVVLTSMTSDFFVEEADEWHDETWKIIRKRSDLDFIILKKRAEMIEEHLPSDWKDGYPNVRLSVSTEDQSAWDRGFPSS